MSKRVIFVTNNGLTDHIGAAQILPYLEGLSRKGHRIGCISVERNWEEDAYVDELNTRITDSLSSYEPIFTKKNLVAKLFSPIFLISKVFKLCRTVRPDFLHCRSYMPLVAVLLANFFYKIPFVFDMRGFWIDERLESGLWDEKKICWRIIIFIFRFLEREAIRKASYIIVLTHDAEEVIRTHPSYDGAMLKVIPCSVDQDVFCVDKKERLRKRAELGFKENEIVLAYLGSAGPLYRVDIVYQLYAKMKNAGLLPKLLFIGSHESKAHVVDAAAIGIDINEDDLICRRTPHNQVPVLLNAADIGLSFRLQSFSSLGVSATKVGEYLSCGLPVISCTGVGDIKEIIEDFKNGYVLESLDEHELNEFVNKMLKVSFFPRDDVRMSSKNYFDMNLAVNKYDDIYRGI
ncbi:glycosyltransferase [Alloalcanivorax venustensis]|uniref:glycosyltransferase n=1 Tax=Alloalcanivorax venustensis TaxID=172371 RepID=UPI001890D45E|nr:glycosyltransferase [Alloalcanivorax venustensis]